jgi:hypothetical protein
MERATARYAGGDARAPMKKQVEKQSRTRIIKLLKPLIPTRIARNARMRSNFWSQFSPRSAPTTA